MLQTPGNRCISNFAGTRLQQTSIKCVDAIHSIQHRGVKWGTIQPPLQRKSMEHQRINASSAIPHILMSVRIPSCMPGACVLQHVTEKYRDRSMQHTCSRHAAWDPHNEGPSIFPSPSFDGALGPPLKPLAKCGCVKPTPESSEMVMRVFYSFSLSLSPSMMQPFVSRFHYQGVNSGTRTFLSKIW